MINLNKHRIDFGKGDVGIGVIGNTTDSAQLALYNQSARPIHILKNPDQNPCLLYTSIYHYRQTLLMVIVRCHCMGTIHIHISSKLEISQTTTCNSVSYTHLDVYKRQALVRLYGITMPDKRNPAANEYCFTPSNAEI